MGSGLSSWITSQASNLISPVKDGNSITGMGFRQRFKGVMRRLSKVSEDQQGASPQRMTNTPSLPSSEFGEVSEDLVSLTELRNLVAALDGIKNGFIDYTLLVAALLPATVFCDEVRIREAFDQFDIRKQRFITADDLSTAMRSAVKAKDAGTTAWRQMISDFDINGDGQLDFDEFRAMLHAGALVDADAADYLCTPTTEPTPSCVGTSRASPGTTTAQTPAVSRLAATPSASPAPTPARASGNLPPTATPPTAHSSSPLSVALFASPDGPTENSRW